MVSFRNKAKDEFNQSCLSKGITAIGAIMGLVALTAFGVDWTVDDTVKTTMSSISNITFIKQRHA